MCRMLNTLPKVSIGVITYNHEKFIVDCLNSIKNQTWKNIELIISDDCSTDGTQRIVKDWVEKNQELSCEVLLAETNMGIAKNLNKVLKFMDGEYLCFFAGDDLMVPQKIGKQVHLMEANKEAGICFSNMHWFQSETNEILFDHFDWLRRPPKNISEVICDNTLPSPTFLFRRKSFPENGFDVNYPIMNDYKIGLLMFDKYPACYVPEPLVWYRRHGENLTVKEFFVSERLRFNKFLKASYGEKFKDAVNKNRAVCTYALLSSIYSKRRKNTKRDLVILIGLMPYFFSSLKWSARGFLLIKLVLKKTFY